MHAMHANHFDSIQIKVNSTQIAEKAARECAKPEAVEGSVVELSDSELVENWRLII